MLRIRPERPADHAAVQLIHVAAFGRSAEAELVAALRALASPLLSLVAERDGRPVGHVLFSPVTIACDGLAPPSGGLAPVSVLPEQQARGVGSDLVRAGLRACANAGWEAVFVLGAPRFYGRFGFVPAADQGLRYAESPAFGAAFQVLELRPGCLAGCTGRVHYHAAFDAV